jgi:DNA end-binding protein Ku
LAKSLISSLATDFDPEKYSDDYRANLKALIQAKVERRETVEPPAGTHLAPVVDIMEALKMSVASTKKPTQSVKSASSESAAPEKPKRTRKGAGAS